MASLLFECFCEEMPARMQDGAREQLQMRLTKALQAHNVLHGEIKTFSSPRHLAIMVADIAPIQPDSVVEKKGPKIGAPQAAIDGFLKSAGVTLEQCEQRQIGKDTVYFATSHVKGRKSSELLQEILTALLADFVWRKSMRWGSHTIQWVRPLHAIAAMLDSEIIPVTFGHITASNITYGHRFLSPAAITLNHANEYVEALHKAYVMVDIDVRKNAVHAAAKTAANTAGLSLVEDAGLLSEVTGLVEWPSCYVGTFEESFMAVPREVLTSEMRHHQKYFALQHKDGTLANHFIITANMICADDGAAIKNGNARVLRARLSDGEFYWNQDRNTKLDIWAEKLRDVVFHAKVGMMDEKVKRIVSLAELIHDALYSPLLLPSYSPLLLPPQAGGVKDTSIHSSSSPPLAPNYPSSPPLAGGNEGGNLTLAQTIASSLDSALSTLDSTSVTRAAQLCKADLVTGMVGEFPELQGIMGRYYALQQGESAQVADAIRDHYKPLGASDDVPTDPITICVALADKIDSIVSLFAAGEKPTGSKDPLALRRAALGVLRIILDNNLELDLTSLIRHSSECWNPSNDQQVEIILFFNDRLRVILKDEGIRHDIVSAAIHEHENDAPSIRNLLTIQITGFNPSAIAAKSRELTAWLASESGAEAFAAIKRVLNILAAEEKKTKIAITPARLALSEPTELALAAAIDALSSSSTLADLTNLTAPINAFFDALLINEECKKDARLALLAQCREITHIFADFSLIEG